MLPLSAHYSGSGGEADGGDDGGREGVMEGGGAGERQAGVGGGGGGGVLCVRYRWVLWGLPPPD